jgi:hypothetical protein
MLHRSTVPITVLLLAAAGGLAAPAASAAPPAPLAEVRIMPMAHLDDDGASLTVRVRVLCRPDDAVQWEGFVSATQGDTFAWAGLPVRCDGRRHVQTVVLPVSAPEGTAAFTRGRASVSAVLQDENTLTTHAQDERTVAVLGGGYGGGQGGMPCHRWSGTDR